MNINAKISEFIEGKISSSTVLAPFFENSLEVYNITAKENAQKPYIRYSTAQPVAQERALATNKASEYVCTVNLNVVGNSLEQVRIISQELFNIFDGIISDENFEHIEDVTATYPEEQKSYDGQSTAEVFEAVLDLTFNFIS